jgi:hypothetical protein
MVSFLDWPKGPQGQRTESARRSTPPRTAKRKHVILFVGANPRGTSSLALAEESAAIEAALGSSSARDDFDFLWKGAVSIDTLMQHVADLQPTVLHFSGHGSGGSDTLVVDEPQPRLQTQRDVVGWASAGIQLQDEQRKPQLVPARALRQMIWSAAQSVHLVVLNACFSDPVADELRRVVDCVVGMRGAINDEAALVFSKHFYRVLGNRGTIKNAVEQAVAALAGRQLPDEHLPVLRTRDGVSADEARLPGLRGSVATDGSSRAGSAP